MCALNALVNLCCRIRLKNVEISFKNILAIRPRASHACLWRVQHADQIEKGWSLSHHTYYTVAGRTKRQQGNVRLKLSVASSVASFLEVSKMELDEFNQVFPEIITSLTDDLTNSDIGDAVAWYKNVIQYNVFDGKKTRGVSVVKCLKNMMQPDQPKDEDIHLAQVVGWCVELLQAFFLVTDDVIDQSATRRGKPCWYKKEGVGLAAINDAITLEAGLYRLLKKYLSQKPYYLSILELFHETTLQTAFGQSLDIMLSMPNVDLNFSKFTASNYAAIVKYKTAFYSFYLPVALAMHMVGISDERLHLKAKSLLLKMGHLFQVQDDFLDCFGDPEITGKHGTDIQDGKCSWLIVTALQHTNPEQNQVLKDNYGKGDIESVAAVKAMYELLALTKMYEEYERTAYEEIIFAIGQLEKDFPTEIFHQLINGIYQRKK